MKARGILNSLFGLWFIIAPWALGFSDDSSAVWSSVILGAIQLIAALWGYGKAGWSVWQSWVVVVTGVWFIIAPFVFSLASGETWTSVILGALTVIFSLWSMGSKSGSSAVG